MHTPIDEKDRQRRKLAAEMEEFAKRGGEVQRITPEQYREHNIYREAHRTRDSIIADLENALDREGNSSWENMEARNSARFALLSATGGDFSMVDGNDTHMHGDGPLVSRKEPDFFNNNGEEREDDDEEPEEY